MTKYTEVILDQNCVQLLDATLDDLSFPKIRFIKSSVNILLTGRLLKSEIPFYSFLYGKKALYISARRCLQLLK